MAVLLCDGVALFEFGIVAEGFPCAGLTLLAAILRFRE